MARSRRHWRRHVQGSIRCGARSPQCRNWWRAAVRPTVAAGCRRHWSVSGTGPPRARARRSMPGRDPYPPTAAGLPPATRRGRYPTGSGRPRAGPPQPLGQRPQDSQDAAEGGNASISDGNPDKLQPRVRCGGGFTGQADRFQFGAGKCADDDVESAQRVELVVEPVAASRLGHGAQPARALPLDGVEGGTHRGHGGVISDETTRPRLHGAVAELLPLFYRPAPDAPGPSRKPAAPEGQFLQLRADVDGSGRMPMDAGRLTRKPLRAEGRRWASDRLPFTSLARLAAHRRRECRARVPSICERRRAATLRSNSVAHRVD